MNVDAFLKNGSLINLGDGKILIGYGPREWLPQPGVFYFQDYFLDKENPWFCHEEIVTLSVEELLQKLIARHREVPTPVWTEPKSKPFFESFDEIESGRLKKIVPYAMATSIYTMTPERLCHCLIHTLTNSKDLHIYGYWSLQGGILGATPEPLFKVQGNKLHTAALAGTSHNKRDATEFLNDPKEKNEHQLVIDGIKNSLKNFGKIEIGNTKVLRLQTLSHLMTPIELELNALADISTLVTSLHPTPAIGAVPKDEGMRWLRYYDTRHPRKHFGAPVGYCYGNTISCLVAIRNVQWTPKGMAIAAGCGIVEQSQPENEWNELQLKIESTYQMLGFKTSSLPKQLFCVLSTVA